MVGSRTRSNTGLLSGLDSCAANHDIKNVLRGQWTSNLCGNEGYSCDATLLDYVDLPRNKLSLMPLRFNQPQ